MLHNLKKITIIFTILLIFLVSFFSVSGQNYQRIFKDESFGFQFSIPDGFTLYRRWDTGAGYNIQFKDDHSTLFDIIILNNQDQISLDGWKNNQIENGIGQVLKEEDLTIDEISAIKKTSSYENTYSISFISSNNDLLYILHFYLGESINEPEFVSSIIGSFRWIPIKNIYTPPENTTIVSISEKPDETSGSPVLFFPFCGHWRISGDYYTSSHVGQYSEYALDWVNYDGDTIGAPIHAAHDGIVYSRAWDDTGGGWLLKLRYSGDNTYTTYYAHLDSFHAPLGAVVNAGDLIAYAGETGGVTGAHLHFSYLHNSYSILPEPMSGITGFAYNQIHFRDCSVPDTIPPVSSISFSGTAGENGWYISSVLVTITASDDSSGVQYSQYNLNGTGWVNYSSPINVNTTGSHTIEYRSVDNAGNWEPAKSTTVNVDFLPPQSPTSLTSGCDISSNVWQNTCNDLDFFWWGASDEGSGLAEYQYYWGQDPLGTGTVITQYSSYNPPPVASNGTYYFKVRSKDIAGNWGNLATLFILRYDTTAPTGTIIISNGMEISYQTLVNLQLNAADNASGVADFRIRNMDESWGDWGAFKDMVGWVLPPQTEQNHTVQIQYRDIAGNISEIFSDTIYLEIHYSNPSSENFHLEKSTFSMASTKAESSHYQLSGSLSQQSSIGNSLSQTYEISAGFWNNVNKIVYHIKIFLPLLF